MAGGAGEQAVLRQRHDILRVEQLAGVTSALQSLSNA